MEFSKYFTINPVTILTVPLIGLANDTTSFYQSAGSSQNVLQSIL